MKIIQIITRMEAGGAQRMMDLLGKELVQADHTVENWFLYQKRPAYAGMPRVRVVLDRCPTGTDYLRIVFRLVRMIRTERPDALITHTYYSNVIGQCIGRIYRINRGIAVQYSPLNTFPVAGRFLDWLVGTLGAHTANVAVADVVFRSAARYPRSYRRRLLRIYNGVPKPIPTGTPREIRTRWDLPLSNPLLIHVERLSKQKNQLFLLDVIAGFPRVHLVLIGEGELLGELMTQIQQRQLQDRIHCMGEVSPETVHDLVSASDVFLFPSRFEAMSMVLLETMHLGIPIVASDIAANRDLLESSAVLLPIDTPERWVTEVRSLLGCRETAARFREEERSGIERFTIDAMAAAYRELLV